MQRLKTLGPPAYEMLHTKPVRQVTDCKCCMVRKVNSFCFSLVKSVEQEYGYSHYKCHFLLRL